MGSEDTGAGTEPPHPFDRIEADHFRADLAPAAARALFQRTVDLVEIEVFSYCNRRCWFCPNANHDRLSRNVHMDPGLYASVVGQLAEIGYAGRVSYSRYNEPLADRVILERIAEARRRLPNAHLHTNTNGDYLDAAYLRDLTQAGLDSLHIQVYLQNTEAFDPDRMVRRIAQITRRLGLQARVRTDTDGRFERLIGAPSATARTAGTRPVTWIEAEVDHPDLTVRLYARDFAINGTSRGDTVPVHTGYVRTSPCLSPFHQVYIDHTGEMMPCCNLRSDVPDHAAAVIGDLRVTPDLFEAWGGAALSAWRRALVGYGEKTGLCRSCTFVTWDERPSNLARQAHLAEIASRLAPTA